MTHVMTEYLPLKSLKAMIGLLASLIFFTAIAFGQTVKNLDSSSSQGLTSGLQGLGGNLSNARLESVRKLSPQDFIESLRSTPVKLQNSEPSSLRIKKDNVSLRGGADAGGGGGVRRIQPQDFPDKEKLLQALGIIFQRVIQSNISEGLKNELIRAAANAYENSLAKFLPVIIVLPPAIVGKISSPNDEPEYLLGHTLRFPGKIFALTKEQVESPENELAADILHEFLHQVLPMGLSMDEDFVISLTEGIHSQPRVSEDLLRAMEYGVYLRKGTVHLLQITQWLNAKLKKYLTAGYRNQESSLEYQSKSVEGISRRLVQTIAPTIQFNISEMKVNELSKLYCEAFSREQAGGSEAFFGSGNCRDVLFGELIQLRRATIGNDLVYTDPLGFKKSAPLLNPCKGGYAPQSIEGPQCISDYDRSFSFEEFFFATK